MLPVRGLLHNVVCPAFRDGECEKQRVGGCLFSHDANLLEKRPHPDNATGAVKRAGPTPTTEGVQQKRLPCHASHHNDILRHRRFPLLSAKMASRKCTLHCVDSMLPYGSIQIHVYKS